MDNKNEQFNIDNFFNDYLKGPIIFKSRDALDPSFIPDELPHRDEQIKTIAQNMACTLKQSTPLNMFLYGKSGTGKTAVIRYVAKKLSDKCLKIGVSLPHWIYINCNQVNSGYRVMITIYNQLDPDNPLPPTGLPRDVVLERLFSLLDKTIGNSVCFIILDEIDHLKDKKSKDNVLYILSRMNETFGHYRVNILGISNVLTFKDDLDSRVCSSLGEEELVFPAYNAMELYDILKARVDLAFCGGINGAFVTDGALRLCAAIAAKENGDARRALSLLRKSAELVERRGLPKLTKEYIYLAQDHITKDKRTVFINNLPVHQKAILLSIYLNNKYKNGEKTSSGEVYNTYSELLKRVYGLNKLTSRRVATLVKELDQAGVTSSNVVSYGSKRGRTRMIGINLGVEIMADSLGNDSRWSEYLNYVPSHIRRQDINVYYGKKYRTLF
ncbi:MAG: Cdc6/Cdc18 family protein [Promethearchaeota archaeon]